MCVVVQVYITYPASATAAATLLGAVTPSADCYQ